MKNIAKSLVVAGAMAVAGSVSADVIADLNPYVGVEYQQGWMKPKNLYLARDIAPKAFQGFDLYVGTKIQDNFGVELGYDWSRNQKKSWTNSNLPKLVNTSVVGKTKAKRSAVHLDLVGFMPVADCTELFASVGVGSVKAKANVTVADKDAKGVALTPAQLADAKAATSVTFKAKTVLRLGAGVNYMVTDMVGLRAKLGWENTSRLRAKFADGTSSKAFKDAVTASAGAFVRF